MIKLIATDMDGTLLNEKGQLPKEFFDILNKLIEKNIKFVAASGRSYVNLKETFKEMEDKLYYICDNGAFVVEDSEISSVEIIDKEEVNNIIKVCSDIKDIQLVLCGRKGAYQIECSEEFNKEIDKYYNKKYILDDLYNIEDDIFKIAICDLGNSAENSYKILEQKFGKNLSVVISGSIWLDIMNQNINKGNALEKIQNDFNISRDETMVFGDFYNDVEMLKKAHYSFVMENANEDMKQYGNFIAKSNVDNGVMEAIKEYVLKEDI